MQDANCKFSNWLLNGLLILTSILLATIAVSLISIKDYVADLEIQANVECNEIAIEAGVIKGFDATITPECEIIIKFNNVAKEVNQIVSN